jgi:hypothetical protein
MTQISMFADETPKQVIMFEQQADEITLMFIGDTLHVTVGRQFTSAEARTLCTSVRTMAGVRTCKRDACLDGLTENSCFVIEFSRYSEPLRLAIKRQIEQFISHKQASLF